MKKTNLLIIRMRLVASLILMLSIITIYTLEWILDLPQQVTNIETRVFTSLIWLNILISIIQYFVIQMFGIDKKPIVDSIDHKILWSGIKLLTFLLVTSFVVEIFSSSLSTITEICFLFFCITFSLIIIWDILRWIQEKKHTTLIISNKHDQ